MRSRRWSCAGVAGGGAPSGGALIDSSARAEGAISVTRESLLPTSAAVDEKEDRGDRRDERREQSHAKHAQILSAHTETNVGRSPETQ